MAVTLQFVDKIDASPTLRLDLNAGAWELQLDGTDFGFPDLERAMVRTLLQDGAQIPASAYGPRTLTLRLRVGGISADAVATEKQKLIRELNRAANILKFAPNTSAPVFFRTFRSTPDSVQPITNGAEEFVVVSILAEPFAYGLKETLDTPTYFVAGDPASTATPNAKPWVDVTGVKGDVETPAFLRVHTGSLNGSTTITSIRRRGTPSNATFVLQAESCTVDTDTTTQPNDASMSGTGNNFTRTTFSTSASLVQRLSASFPTTFEQPVDQRGTYRVVARLRASTSTASVFTLQLKWGTVGVISGDLITLSTSTTNTRLVDLGLISFPSGNDPVTYGYSGVELPLEHTALKIYAGRTSGTASLDLDYFLFLPADEEMCVVSWADDVAFPVLDGPRDMAWSYTNSTLDVVQTGDPSEVRGKLPMLTPNATNRLFWLRNYGTSSLHTLTASIGFDVLYWPRYLYVAPA